MASIQQGLMNDDALKRSAVDGESGITMIELVVAMAMMVILTGAAASMLISAFKAAPSITGRAEQVGDARVALERMVRDIRQATGLAAAPGSGSEVKLSTYVHALACNASPTASAAARLCRVTYTCAKSGTCTRRAANVNGTSAGTSVTVVTGVANYTSVFTLSPSTSTPAYITVKLRLPTPDGDGFTTLEDGAALRGAAANLVN